MTLLAIDTIDIGQRYRRDMGDLAGLAESIDTTPVVLPLRKRVAA